MVYYCFNNTFLADFGIPYLNIPQITIDDKPRPDKRACYTPDPPPVAISVTYEKIVSALTTLYDLEQLFLLTSDNPKPPHAIMKYESYHDRVRGGYCCRKQDEKICYKKARLYCSTLSNKDKKVYYCSGFSMKKVLASELFLENPLQ